MAPQKSLRITWLLVVGIAFGVAGLFSAQQTRASQRAALRAEMAPLSPDRGLVLPAKLLAQAEPLTADELAQAEQGREEIRSWLKGMLDAYPYLATYGDTSMAPAIEDLLAQLDELSPEQVATAREQLGSHPAFWDYPDYLIAIFDPSQPRPSYYLDIETRLRSELQAGLVARAGSRPRIESGLDAVLPPDPTQTAPFPDPTPFPTRSALPERPEPHGGCPGDGEQVCQACPDGAGIEAEFAAKVLGITTTAIDDAMTAEQDFCIFPGVGVTVPNFVKAITSAIAVANDLALMAISFSNELEELCISGYHNALTDLFLDETISSRASQANLDEISERELRIEIENNLLLDSDLRIGIFQLPQHLCGGELPAAESPMAPAPTPTPTGLEGFRFCGHLELVREIVNETIDRNTAAGVLSNFQAAKDELDAGDMHYMNSQWKSAYERYSNAYRLAVSQAAERD